MNKNNILAAKTAIFVAALGMTLASCSSDDEIAKSYYPSDNIVRIDAGVNNMITRASVETSTLNEIGFTILNENPTNGKNYSYDNYQVTKINDSWTPAKQMLWQNATQPVTVIAYAPYNKDLSDVANKSDYEVTVAPTQTSNTYESDFLVYKQKNFLPKDVNTNGAVPITFSHALSQLEIKVVFGTELDPLTESPVTSIKVGNLSLKGKCDFTQDTPAVTAVDGEEATVTPYEIPNSFVAATHTDAGDVSNASTKYSCILIPQAVAAGKFSVALQLNGSDKTYTWVSPNNVTLAGGNKYTLTLTVGKDYVVAGNMTATQWKDAGTTSIETD